VNRQSLRKLILGLEQKMLRPEIRESPAGAAKIISPDFVEYCSSGYLYRYQPNDTFPADNCKWEIVDFEIRILAPNWVHANYKVIKHNTAAKDMKYSLRSSLWRRSRGTWKMVFHQGTPTTKFSN
jgi:hypothetical protein